MGFDHLVPVMDIMKHANDVAHVLGAWAELGQIPIDNHAGGVAAASATTTTPDDVERNRHVGAMF
jgi:hypothetical protein